MYIVQTNKDVSEEHTLFTRSCITSVDLETILKEQIYAICVVMLSVHILTRSPQIFGCNLKASRYRIEDISKGILTPIILIIRIVSVLMLHLHH